MLHDPMEEIIPAGYHGWEWHVNYPGNISWLCRAPERGGGVMLYLLHNRQEVIVEGSFIQSPRDVIQLYAIIKTRMEQLGWVEDEVPANMQGPLPIPPLASTNGIPTITGEHFLVAAHNRTLAEQVAGVPLLADADAVKEAYSEAPAPGELGRA